MYKKIPFFLVFLIIYITLRNIIYLFYPKLIDGYRGMPYHINTPRFSNTGVNVSSTVYDINHGTRYDQYCYNNSTLCSNK
jgi:hypothetical protein